MNKQGQLLQIIILIGGLIFLVLIAAGMTIGWGVVKTATDEILPAFADIGDIGVGNVSEYVAYSTVPAGILVDNFALLIGLIYLVGIGGLISYAFMFRNNANGWVMALFVISIMLLIITCIAVSNFYEEFYLQQDELGEILRSAALISYLIIYSPVIMTFIAFIAGIILFTGNREESFNV